MRHYTFNTWFSSYVSARCAMRLRRGGDAIFFALTQNHQRARRKLWELFHRQICSAVHFVKGTHVCGKLASKLWLVKFDGRYSNAISLIIACLSQRRLYSIGSVLMQILSYQTETVLSNRDRPKPKY